MGPCSLYLTDRASRVPGLSNKLKGWKDCHLIHLDIASAAKGCATFAVNSPLVESLDQTPVLTQIPIDESVYVTPAAKPEEHALPTYATVDLKEPQPKDPLSSYPYRI